MPPPQRTSYAAEYKIQDIYRIVLQESVSFLNEPSCRLSELAERGHEPSWPAQTSAKHLPTLY